MSLPSQPRCFITGGASGLGRSLSLILAEKKARLWVADLNLVGAQETCAMALQRGALEAHAFACDVSDKNQIQGLANKIQEQAGGIDLVVNNAGTAVAGDFLDIPLKDWEWIVGINFYGVLYGCHAFLPMMKAQNSGHILNIASAAGLLNPSQLSPYNVTKSAVISLSESLHGELRGTGVHVSVVCPTFFPTSIVSSGRMHSQKVRDLGSSSLSSSRATPDGVAHACVRAVESNRLYILPMLDARLLWRLKRLFPVAMLNLMSWVLQRMERKK